MKRGNVRGLPGRARQWGMLILAAAVLCMASSAEAALRHYWKFDETGGNTAYSALAGGINGTLMMGDQGTFPADPYHPNPTPVWSGDVATVLTHSTGSLQFETTLDEWVDIGPLGMLCDNQSTSLHGTTVSMWIKPGDDMFCPQLYDWTGAGSSSTGHMCGGPRLNDGDVVGDPAVLAMMGRKNDNSGYQFRTITDAGEAGTPIVTNEWQHVAITYIGDYAYCYVNGQVSNYVAIHTNFGFDGTSGFGIGCQRRVKTSTGDYSSTQCFDGLIDDVAIWDKALTPAAIAQLAAGANPTTIVERPAQTAYLQVINVDMERIKDGVQLPAYTGKGAVASSGATWNQAVIEMGFDQGDRDAIKENMVDSHGNATPVGVRIMNWRTCELDSETDAFGIAPNPLAGDRMWASGAETYAPEEWYIDGLEVGASYDIYFLGAMEATIAITAGANAVSAEMLVDSVPDSSHADNQAGFRIVDDVPDDWIEGINYAVLRNVVPTSSTISGTVAPDVDLSTIAHLFGIQIAKASDPPAGIPGDTNGDKVVDATDAAKLATNWGRSTGVSGPADGDFNNDDRVDAHDASILAANWGDHRGEAGAPVPEPSTAMLLLALAAPLLAHRRR